MKNNLIRILIKIVTKNSETIAIGGGAIAKRGNAIAILHDAIAKRAAGIAMSDEILAIV